MKLIIYSPEKTVFDGEVDVVELPGGGGRFTVLKDHDAVITTLVSGNVRYSVAGEETLLPIQSGYDEVLKNVVSVCVYL